MVSRPENGNFAVIGNKISYMSVKDSTGTTSFTYMILYGKGASETAQVSVNVVMR